MNIEFQILKGEKPNIGKRKFTNATLDLFFGTMENAMKRQFKQVCTYWLDYQLKDMDTCNHFIWNNGFAC